MYLCCNIKQTYMHSEDYIAPQLEIVEVWAELGTMYSSNIDVLPGEENGDEEWI